MQDISVLYLSKVTWMPGMRNVRHTHDYWHFSMGVTGENINADGTLCKHGCTCCAPGVPHAGTWGRTECDSFNIMFFVHDKKLYKQLEAFPFEQLRLENLFVPVLENILEQCRTLTPTQEFVNSAFSYYLHLVMESNQMNGRVEPQPETLTDRCLAYIEANYMKQLKLEDVADHIGRTKSYTSYLVSTNTGSTVVEHLNEVRIKNACTMLAYSDASVETVAEECGFTNVKNFCRVFKNIVGTTPNRYRTSHAVDDMDYMGELKELDIPYQRPVYTYIPSARKCVNWRTPLEYISQAVRESD